MLSEILQFIDKHFDKRSRIIKDVVYVLIVLFFLLVFFNNYSTPPLLEGEFYVREGDITRAAVDYEIRYARSSFRTNSRGRWMLPTRRTLPGKVTACIIDPQGIKIGEVKLRVPFPIIPWLDPKQILIEYDQHTQGFRVNETAQLDYQLIRKAYAQTATFQNENKASAKNLFVKIKKLSINESGDSKDRVGEMYFKIYINENRIRPAGFPEKEYPNTYLLIADGTTIEFNNFKFLVEGIDQNFSSFDLVIEIRDRDPPRFLVFRPHDDKVGIFSKKLRKEDIGREITIETQPLEREWPDNSWIVIELLQERDSQ